MQMRFGMAALMITAGVFAAAGCGQANDKTKEIANCSGDFAGVFTGTAVGSITGTLSADGALHLEFSPSDPAVFGNVVKFTYDVSGLTQASFPSNNGNQTLDGSFDFDNCSLSGNWTLSDSAGHDNSGTYSISKQ